MRQPSEHGGDTGFRAALRRLDAAGRLAKIARPVNPHLELAALMKRYDGGPAMLFESVDGHDMPVLGNLLASPDAGVPRSPCTELPRCRS